MSGMSLGWLMTAVCTLGTVRSEWATRLALMLPPMGRMRLVTEVLGYEGVSHARNVAMHMVFNKEVTHPETGLPADFDYLMYYDDDIVPRSRAALQMLVSAMDQNSEIGVIGGVYPRRGELPEPIVVHEPGKGAWWGWKDGGLHRVYMTGTGFTVIRLSAVRDLAVPTYKTEDGTEIRAFFIEDAQGGDDFRFADLCMAADIPWYVHGSVQCDQIDRDGTWYRLEKAEVLV